MRILRPTFLIGLIAAVAGAFPFSPAFADAPKVTAVLSNSTATIGQPVQLQIHVTGAGGANVPDNIAVDGLEIHPTGTSRQVEMQNFNISQSIIFNYTILPMRSGRFHIPPQVVKIGGNSFRTPELELIVEGGGTPPAGNGGNNGRPAPAGKNAKVAFAEIIVTKPTAYVGEIVPVEIRLGFNAHLRAPRLIDGPDIQSQGFTMQKLQAPDQPRMETIGGIPYQVLTFKTAIAGARPGKFEIGPVQAGALVLVPRQSGSRSRGSSPFDLFNLDDPFSDPFFSDPYGAVGQQEKIAITSDPAAIEVKPLPPNAPPSFSGAVGNFNLHVDANPKKVQVGDPITVTTTISGRGDFDRVMAPVLPDERGWHTYPPSSKFKQDDDVGMSGTKTFETVISPNERKDAIPPLEFSYFDPLGDKYVSLKSDRIPVHVEGEPLAAQGTTAAAPAGATPQPSPSSPQVTARPGEILEQLDERKKAAQTFAPLFERREFWLAQIAPLLALLGLLGWKIRRAARRNEKALRVAAWQREIGDLRRKLRRDAGSADFFADASRILQIRTALKTGSDPETVSAADAGRILNTDDQMRDQIREIFDRRDELLYSGAANGSASLAADERDPILHLVEELSR